MEPVTLVIAALAAAGASAAKSIISSYFRRDRAGSHILELVTSDGKKISISASELTRDKIAEITNTRTAAPAARAY
jgi:hypothetical protein